MRLLKYKKTKDDIYLIYRFSWRKLHCEHWLTNKRGIINTINRHYDGNYLLYRSYDKERTH